MQYAISILAILLGTGVASVVVACLQRKWSKQDKEDFYKEEIKSVKTDLNKLFELFEETNAVNARTKIIEFGDSMLHGVKHSKDNYDNILIASDKYDDYCERNPNFRNSVTSATQARIKAEYAELLKTGDFLK